jgi:hypothetical protein
MSDGSHVRWRVSFVALFVLYITTGVIFYTQYEKWTFVTALYFTTVTLCTVGYGDQLPSDQSYVFLVRPTAAQTPIAETTARAPPELLLRRSKFRDGPTAARLSRRRKRVRRMSDARATAVMPAQSVAHGSCAMLLCDGGPTC